MKIAFHDIQKRIRCLSESTGSFINLNVDKFNESCQRAIQSGNPNNLIFCIESGINNNSIPIQINSILACFDKLCEVGSIGSIKKMGFYIAEEGVPKVRDAKETNTNLRRKLARIKTNTVTKVNNNIADALNLGSSIVQSAKSNFKKNTAAIKSNINKKPAAEEEKQQAALECYNAMIDKSLVCIHCDRVLENYNKLCKRFNIDRIITENTPINGIEDTVFEICRLVDTYDVPDKVKFNTVLDTCYYGFASKHIKTESVQVLQPAVDYFISKPDGKTFCKSIIENSIFYNMDPDTYKLDVFMEDEPEDSDLPFAPKLTKVEEELYEASTIGCRSKVFDVKPIQEKSEFDKLFADFKSKEDEHKENKLKNFILSTYTKNVDNIVDGTPKLLNWIRQLLVVGTVAINPILGAIVIIADQFVRLHLSRKETEKMLKCFNNEIKASEKKLESVKNADEQERLRKYILKLEEAKSKINDYYETMLTDAEIDAKYDDDSEDIDTFSNILNDDDGSQKSKDSNDDDLDDFDFGDDDDLNFDDDDLFKEFASLNEFSIKNKLSDVWTTMKNTYNSGMQHYKDMSTRTQNQPIEPFNYWENRKEHFLAVIASTEDINLLKYYKQDAKNTIKSEKNDIKQIRADGADEEYIKSYTDFIKWTEGVYIPAVDKRYKELVKRSKLNDAVLMIPVVEQLLTRLTEDLKGSYINDPKSEEFLSMFYGCDMDSIAKFSAQNPDIIDPEVLGLCVNQHMQEAKTSNTPGRYYQMALCENASNILKATRPIVPTDIFEVANTLAIQVECVEAINEMIYIYQNMSPITEVSFTNRLKMASEKIRKGLQNLSDKEKTISKNVDVSVNNMKHAVERSLTNDNREAIIKGSILPSASKIIKLAITSGALFLINPVLAVIATLGYLGTSAKYKAKERQAVLDEIETELKICEKYIDLAEQKNDMKALKNLYTIQRNLERQRQRIKYNMNMKFKQKTYDTEHVND